MAAHEYHGLWWNFGPFGRQDIHLHPCTAHERCSMEMVGEGHDCEGKKQPHAPKKLTVGAIWSRKDQEGKPLHHAISDDTATALASGDSEAAGR